MLNTGLVYSVDAMAANVHRLDAVTYNLANAGTIGFKRRLTAVEARETGHRGQMLDVEARTRVDFSQGPIQQTGNRFDLALDGDGWFVVEGPQGELMTRRGDFRVNGEGLLETQEGYPVAWQAAPARLEATGTAITVGGNGEVYQDGVSVGQLQIVSLPEQDRMREVDSGYWLADPSSRRQPSDAVVHQFHLEGSNSTAVDELVQMISVQRQYESAAKLLQMLDRSFERLNRS